MRAGKVLKKQRTEDYLKKQAFKKALANGALPEVGGGPSSTLA